jgi:serine/threonine protein kinase
MSEQAAANDPDQQIGKYRLLELLGKGTSGTVYRALDTESDKSVALKVIDPEVFRDPEFGAERHTQFLAEASLAGMLIHPYIVSILDAVVEGEVAYIAMELVTGGDLSQFTDPGALLPVPDVIEIAFNCCSALEYTSRVGIIHCDIKPANIMVAEETDVRITDFGAAFLRKSQVVRTAAMGSPHYMSPEQIAGQDLTLHSDMYSLGVVLYELLTGTLPFAADELNELVHKILTMDPAPPSGLRPELSPEIDRIVLRALKKNRTDRYNSWVDFARELSDVSRQVLPPREVSASEKLNALKQVEALATLSDLQLQELARAAQWARVKTGEVLVKENELGANLFFLASGSAKVIRRDRLLNLIKAGEFFGEMPYVQGRKSRRHATVVTTKDLLIAEFKPSALARINPSVQLQLTRAIARNLVERLTLSNSRLAG